MVTRISMILVMLFTLYACSKDKKDKMEGGVQTDTTLADSLRLSPASILINNDSLLLSAYLWRDFMPGTGENGSGLYCSSKVMFKDSLPIPSGLIFKKLYVIDANQIWTNQQIVIDHENPSVIKGVVSNGPKWGPATFVDVVCELEINNTIYRLIAKQQKIEATY
jgi:hypothetical protein